MKEKIIKTKKYVSSDGKSFHSQASCLEYEKEKKAEANRKKLAKSFLKIGNVQRIDVREGHKLSFLFKQHRLYNGDCVLFYLFYLPDMKKQTMEGFFAYIADEIPGAAKDIKTFLSKVPDAQYPLTFIVCYEIGETWTETDCCELKKYLSEIKNKCEKLLRQIDSVYGNIGA